MKAPHRAHRLTLSLEADTQDDLCRALENLSLRIQMGEVHTGSWGSSTDGANYEYLVDPTIDHDAYFAGVQKYLAEKRDAKEAG